MPKCAGREDCCGRGHDWSVDGKSQAMHCSALPTRALIRVGIIHAHMLLGTGQGWCWGVPALIYAMKAVWFHSFWHFWCQICDQDSNSNLYLRTSSGIWRVHTYASHDWWIPAILTQFLEFTSAPFETRNLAMSRVPRVAAKCNGESPSCSKSTAQPNHNASIIQKQCKGHYIIGCLKS